MSQIPGYTPRPVQKSTVPKKTNEKVSWRRLEQKWAVMQRHVYQRQIHSVDELKRRLIDV